MSYGALFVLADIALKAGNKPKAIEYLALSLETSSLNQTQKGESHLLLANLYYEDEQYVKAKKNFDSALSALSKNDERYVEVEQLSKGLTDIVKNIEIITLQDSLLKVGAMSPEEKRKLAANIKKQQAEITQNCCHKTNKGFKSQILTDVLIHLVKEIDFFASFFFFRIKGLQLMMKYAFFYK